MLDTPLKDDDICQFPNEFVDPKVKKTAKYIGNYLKAMLYRHRQNGTIYNKSYNRFIINRKYAEGLQSIDKYKDLFDLEGDTSFLNLDWSVVPIAAKYVDLLVGELSNTDYKIQCNSIDSTSITAMDKYYNEMLANMELKDFNEQVKQVSGMELIPSDSFIPSSKEELDMHMQLTYKQATEIAMEKALLNTYKANKWQEVKRKVIRDLVVLKKAAIKHYIDENGIPRLRYVDPVRLITPYTDQDDFSNIKYAGELINVELHQLRRMSRGQLTDEQLFAIAKNCSGQNGNREWLYGETLNSYYGSFGEKNDWRFDDFLITLFDGEFHSINVHKFEEKNNSYGGFFYEERGFNYEPSEDKKTKIDKKELDVIYKGTLIVGTDWVINYGIATDMTRDKTGGIYSSDTGLSYIIYAPNIYDMENKSILERMIPHADGVQIVVYKIQQLVAKLTPPGLAVDISALKDVFLGKGKPAAMPLQIQDLYLATGTYYYNGETEDGIQMNRNPIQPISNSMGLVFQELTALYNFHIQQIRDITGINENRDSSSVDKDAPVATSQMALKASRNATRNITDSFLYMYQSSAKKVCLMIQDAIEYGEYEDVLQNIIGHIDAETLEVGDKIPLVEYGIFVEPLPSEEEQMMLSQDISISLQQKELRLEDAIIIRQIGKQNVKQANQYLILRRKMYSQEKVQEQQVLIQENAKTQQESSDQAAQQQMAVLQAEIQKELAIIEAQAKVKAQEDERKHMYTMQELSVKGEWAVKTAQTTHDENFKQMALQDAMNRSAMSNKM